MAAIRRLAITRKTRVFGTIWFGQLISILGSSLSSFALAVWAYQRAGAATQISLLGRVLKVSIPGLGGLDSTIKLKGGIECTERNRKTRRSIR